MYPWFGPESLPRIQRRVPLASAEGAGIVGGPRACGRDHVLRCELTDGRI